MKSEIVPTNGEAPTPVTKDITLIGRGEDCDIQIDDPSLSKRHAVLVRTEGLLLVRDLVSTNGTKVNGQRVMWAALLPNDRLTLGRFKVRIYLGSDQAPSPSETYLRKAGAAVASMLSGGLTASPQFAAPEHTSTPDFAPPTPIGIPVSNRTQTGSTEPDAETQIPQMFVLDDEEFSLDLEY